MVKRKTAIAIRKTHRYLGLFLGIQFLFWTISGIYFSWTDIDEIHGDQFLKAEIPVASFEGLLSPSQCSTEAIRTLGFRQLGDEPYYFINEEYLVHAQTGKRLTELTEAHALRVASRFMAADLQVEGVKKLTATGKHHEYRGRPLPAYVIQYRHPEKLTAYVSATDGSFERVRYRSWRWFDFLWMTHTMDYEGRDNFNTTLLRVFSLLGLITVLSGFVLWSVSSPSLKRVGKKGQKQEIAAKRKIPVRLEKKDRKMNRS